MDRIFIRDLAVKGKHGVSDEERSREQEFVLDIVAGFDTSSAAGSDNLADTVDYNQFRDGAKGVVETQSFRLLERLADAVARKILEDTRLQEVSVTIRKTEMYPDCTPGITVVRRRS